MKLSRTGIILFTERYDDCVAFYRDTLELPVLFRTPEVTCLGFGESYLLVEPGRKQESTGNPTCLRFNVPDVHAEAAALRHSGIAVAIESHPWGTVGIFHDPDGNLCELKDEDAFGRHITGLAS